MNVFCYRNLSFLKNVKKLAKLRHFRYHFLCLLTFSFKETFIILKLINSDLEFRFDSEVLESGF